MEGHVEIRGVKNLPKFFLNRAQHFVLVQARADGLSDLGEELIFLGAALSVVHYDVVFQRESDLQRETDQQAQIGIAKQPALGVRKKDYAEIVLASLQADCGDVMNVLCRQDLSKLLESPARKRRQRLGHFAQIAESHEATASVCQFANVLSCAACVEGRNNFGRKAQLHRWQYRPPAL